MNNCGNNIIKSSGNYRPLAFLDKTTPRGQPIFCYEYFIRYMRLMDAGMPCLKISVLAVRSAWSKNRGR